MPQGVGMSSSESAQDPGESPSQDGNVQKRSRGSPTLLSYSMKEQKTNPLERIGDWGNYSLSHSLDSSYNCAVIFIYMLSVT